MASIISTPFTKTPFGLTFRDARGVVYVEFLLAFIPLFLLFLGTCQLVLLTAARLVVSHAAVTAARSAIVVLEDTSDDYGGAPRGNLSKGKALAFDWGAFFRGLGMESSGAPLQLAKSSSGGARYRVQHGARMAAIRLAATTPLLTLAPKTSATLSSSDSLDNALVGSSAAQLAFAHGYTEAATAVTIQQNESSDDLADEPIDPKGAVTVEVTYLYQCGVPVVRGLMCRALSSLLDSHAVSADAKKAERLSQFASPQALTALSSAGGRYIILTGQSTLANQGAGYLTAENP